MHGTPFPSEQERKRGGEVINQRTPVGCKGGKNNRQNGGQTVGSERKQEAIIQS